MDQVGDDDVGPVENRAAGLLDVHAPGCRDKHIELAVDPVDMPVLNQLPMRASSSRPL